MPVRLTSGWKVWMIVLSIPLGVLVSIIASVRIADGNTSKQIRQQCGATAAIIQAYEETPPSTPTGRNVQQAYIDQYRILGCPPKTK